MTSVLAFILIALLLTVQSISVKILTTPSDLETSQYDFVVVGGGTAVIRPATIRIVPLLT